MKSCLKKYHYLKTDTCLGVPTAGHEGALIGQAAQRNPKPGKGLRGTGGNGLSAGGALRKLMQAPTPLSKPLTEGPEVLGQN